MRALKKALALIMSAAVSATMFCSAAVADSAPAKTFGVNESTVKILGRSFTQDGYTCFSYGSSGIDVNFTGTDFYIDVAQLDGANASTDIMVLVDTLMPMEATKYTVTANTGWLKVASGLSQGEHSIRIMKMSRGIGAGGWFGTDWFGIRAIGTSNGSILAPDAKSDIIIEAYGDSITNGDAVWLNADGTSSAYTWGAYSGVVARLLDADVYSTGNSGNGLNSWCLGAGNLFPPRESWSQMDPRASQSGSVDHSETDVVIINLGTNDMAAITNNSEECAEYTEEAFKQSYISWMQDVRRDAPNAIVIGALGAMGADLLFDDIQAAVDYVNAEAGETYAYFLQLDRCGTIAGGLGYDNGHPSNVAHEIYGAQMAELIAEKLDLDYAMPEEETDGYTNLALSKGVMADSVKDGALKTNVNDGDNSTYWRSASVGSNDDPADVGIEFGTAVEFDSIKLVWGTIASTTGYSVQYSTDGKNFTDVSNKNVTRDGSIDTVTFDGVYASYVRIVITGMEGKNTYPSVCEFAVYDSTEIIIDKTVNLAINGTAIDSGKEYYNSSNSAANANDGSNSTRWQYASTSAIQNGTALTDVWLGIELDNSSLLEKTVITWESATRCAQGGYVIQYSNDGANWTLVTGAAYSYGADVDGIATDTVTFDGVTAKYIRVVCNTATSSKYCPKIAELEVYA